MIGKYESTETGRFRISIDDEEEGVGATTPWTPPDEVAILLFRREFYLAVSYLSPLPLPGGKIYSLKEADLDLEVEHIGVN